MVVVISRKVFADLTVGTPPAMVVSQSSFAAFYWPNRRRPQQEQQTQQTQPGNTPDKAECYGHAEP